ncbi:MAG: aminopeptidase [Firmicutes bacterium]|nr:aminopeptidase [Bacillota bacterium]
MRELEDKYIELILKRCLNFENKKSLMIHLDLKEHIPIAMKIKKKAQSMGISDVCIHINDLYELHDYLKNTPLDKIELNDTMDRSDWDLYAKKGGALLFLNSKVPGLMNDISSEKMQKVVELKAQTQKYYREHVKEYIFPWTIVDLPNKRWAETVFPGDKNAYDKLYMSIMKMCMVDREDPVKAWQEWIDKNNYYKDKLNELEISEMHYKNSLGTDLHIGLPKGSVWLNLDKLDANGNPIISNMPSYEIFNTPNKWKTNGVVYSSKPFYCDDVCINNFKLVFKDGKVVDCEAEEGEEVLKTLIQSNDNACYLGEVALVPHDSPISNTGIVFNETLFDENSSCHLAFGKATPRNIRGYHKMSKEELNRIGFNDAPVHEDFMIGTSDLEIEATTKKGKILIFKNGNFNI